MKFSIEDFSSKCDQIRSFVRIWSHLLKKSLMENFIFCAVHNLRYTLVGSSDVAWKHYVVSIENWKINKIRMMKSIWLCFSMSIIGEKEIAYFSFY